MPDTISTALLIVRIGLGVIFLAHGIKHARGRVKTSKWFASIGFKSAGLQWFASTATEIGVGVLLIIGLLTGLAAAGVIGVMAVAYWMVHRPAGFFITSFMKEGIEVGDTSTWQRSRSSFWRSRLLDRASSLWTIQSNSQA